MTKRIFNSISAVAILVTAVMASMFTALLYNYFSSEQMSRLREETHIVAHGVTLMGRQFLEDVSTQGSRITWIDTDGTVIFDSYSDTSAMENHNEREEIAQAIKTGYGESKRYSDTLTQQYFYCAVRIENGTIVRLSASQDSGLVLLWSMLSPLAIIIVFVVRLSLVFATHLSKSIINPLNELNLDNPTDFKPYEELSPLLGRIDSQQKEIRLQTYELQRKKDELDTIVGSMNEGIVLLKSNGFIMSINNTAKDILGITGRAVNKDFIALCQNNEINSAIAKVWEGKHIEKVLDLNKGIYRLNASPVFSENRVVGVALLFFDVTEKEKAEEIRRQFTANVSHELKSPLHSIAGYSELIMNEIATGEDVIHFSQRINSEAKRMSAIIQDIITLSQLDEGGTGMVTQPVELYSLAQSALNNIKEAAESLDISLELKGESTTVNGILPLIQSVIYNLCENAVNYNRPGGSITLTVTDCGQLGSITVEDTGIGIAPEHQESIFQRFYRIDKSRSREKGGSGLGLSIVKHAVKIHNGKIDLESTLDKGTKITVTLPK